MLEVKPRILVLGGYGNFGKRICKILAKEPNIAVWIAGRDLAKAKSLEAEIKAENPLAEVDVYTINWKKNNFIQKLEESKATIVIHTAGPFQKQDYTVAMACIQLKMHYIDLADARDFVVNIKQLDENAKANGVCVLSGASTVPGLSSAIIENYFHKFETLREIDFGIVPGNKAERGEATVAGVLKQLGKPFLRLENGIWKTVYGWQNVHRHYYGDNLGYRWHANLDIPDLTLLPEKYPTLKTVIFHVGLEISLLHFIMWQMSWLSRTRIVKNWAPMSNMINKVSHLFDKFGTDKGGMYVHMAGTNREYQPMEITWLIVAEKGEGPYIPIIPAIIVTKKIIQNATAYGARPCMGEFSLEEFEKEISAWHMYTTVEKKVM